MALSWLGSAARSMFYLVSPWDLALDDSDPAPQILLRQGIPMFFFFIVLEAVFVAARRRAGFALQPLTPRSHPAPKFETHPRYRLNDTVTCIMLGSLQRLGELLLELLGLTLHVSAYRVVYTRCRLLDFSPKDHVLLCYVALLLGKDLAYYWAHRLMHEYHAVWLTHSVHHSGQDYNMGTGLRQGVAQPLFTWLFYLPFALLGFHPHAFAAHAQLNTLYMFWIHTDLVDRLPAGLEYVLLLLLLLLLLLTTRQVLSLVILLTRDYSISLLCLLLSTKPTRYVLNSPMAHRMHHRPPGNCNYAGVFIFWDRLFGTYRAERERRDWYGLAAPPQTFDLAVLNSQHAAKLTRATMSSKNKQQQQQQQQQPASWGRWLLARRVPARWTCSFGALLEPIPPSEGDRRAEGPANPGKVWDGAGPMLPGTATNVALASLMTVAGAFALLLKSKDMHRLDALVATLLAAALMLMVCRACDQQEAPRASASRALASCALLLPVLAFFVAAQPAARFAATTAWVAEVTAQVKTLSGLLSKIKK